MQQPDRRRIDETDGLRGIETGIDRERVRQSLRQRGVESERRKSSETDRQSGSETDKQRRRGMGMMITKNLTKNNQKIKKKKRNNKKQQEQ